MIPSELRIGNLLIDKLTGSYLKVVEITDDSFTASVIDRSKFPLPDGWKAIPIEITDEIIKVLGFTCDESNNYIIYQDEGILSVEFWKSEIWISDYHTANSLPHIKTLHSLQNLIWSFSGEELDVLKLTDQS